MKPGDLFGGSGTAVTSEVAGYREEFEELTKQYAALEKQKKDLESQQKVIKETLFEKMNALGLKSEKSSTCSFFISEPTVKESISIKKLKEENEPMYHALDNLGYVSKSEVAAGITVRVNKPKKEKSKAEDTEVKPETSAEDDFAKYGL